MSVDKDVIQERLRLLRELLEDLGVVGEVDERRLSEDRIVRHAVERVLTQLVDLSVSINSHIAASVSGQAPTNYRDSFQAVAGAGAITQQLAEDLAPSASLRNVLTHEYVTIDLAVVAAAVPTAQRLYAQYVRQMAVFLAANG